MTPRNLQALTVDMLFCTYLVRLVVDHSFFLSTALAKLATLGYHMVKTQSLDLTWA